MNAHHKLSDYYMFDESLLYTWVAHMWSFCSSIFCPTNYVLYLALDSHILYEGMKSDYADDNILTKYLESAKVSLHTYFYENYAG